MTLLEYVCEKLMGPPRYRRGNGESQWPCPKCDHRSFHTLPHSDQYKDRAKCFRCGFRGDVYDVLWLYYPGSNFGHRKALLAEFQDQYERGDHDDGPCGDMNFPPRGEGSNEPTMKRPGDVAGAWADLTDDERAVLIAALKIVRKKAPGVHMEALAVYAKEAQDWFDRDPEDIEREWLDRLREERREQAARDAEQREQSLKLIASWAAKKKAREQAEAKKRRGPKPIRRAQS
jgi:predicted RNA-binding Zn-ribbon protein involved in translation (DUF1610 family)